MYCEYYTELRWLAKENGIPGAQLLDDTYLFHRPEVYEMAESYGDVMKYISEPVPEVQKPTGLRGFLENWLGVMLLGTERDLEYEKLQARNDNIKRLKSIFRGEQYPERLFPSAELAGRISLDTPHYIRNYSILSLILLFFIFSLIGWMWDCLLYTSGIMIGEGMSPEEATKKVGMVVEGMFTTEAAYELARRENVEMPITEAIYLSLIHI